VRFEGIIFDFDGVIVDSEIVSNTVLAEALTALGRPMTTEEAIDRFIGRHWADTEAAIEALIGRPLPADFRERTRVAFAARLDEIGAVEGAAEFLDSVREVPKAVASSSRSEWLRSALARLGLAHHFGDRLYSAAERVERGKPHPDIYLYAAAELGIEPGRLLVIEDTAPGVQAGVAAGMTVVGLCAASHCAPGYEDRLVAAGAARVVSSYAEITGLLNGLGRRHGVRGGGRSDSFWLPDTPHCGGSLPPGAAPARPRRSPRLRARRPCAGCW
jgi:HAD superfamily hydrolase (TIGR01509 family)